MNQFAAFWNRYPNRFAVVFGSVAALLFIVEHINGRFWLNDFRVYYGAGEAILRGEPLYGVAHGLDSGVFKYAPLLAVVYALFALLPYSIAASIQYLLITLAFVDGMRRIDRSIRTHVLPGRIARYGPLFLTGLVGVVHLHRELHLGNINVMLLWLLVVALEHMLRSRTTLGAVLLGAAMLAKPHFVVLVPLLLLRGKFRIALVAIGTVAVGLLAPMLMLGWNANLALHSAWLGAMAEHNAALIYTSGDDHRAVNTIYSFIYRAGLGTLGVSTSSAAYGLLGLIALLIGVLVLTHRLRERRHATRDAFPFEYLLLVGLVPSITLTDTEHFLFALPLVMVVILHLLPTADPRWLPWLAVPLLFMYGGNWEDALGPASTWMIEHGVLGIGSFGILLLAVALHLRSNHSRARTSEQP